jgi:glycerol-3-phosphate dehydrogenase (NAD(P)+)
MRTEQTVIILGQGAWATAIAMVLAANGHSVILWCQDESVADEINSRHTNEQYLAQIKLDTKISATTDIKKALDLSAPGSWIFEAIPVPFLRTSLVSIQPHVTRSRVTTPHATKQYRWGILSKGIEKDTGLFPSQIVNELFPEHPTAVISGPSFAKYVAQKDFTGLIVASTLPEIGQEAIDLLQNDQFQLAYRPDLIGIQMAGAAKNVLAIAMGLIDGLGYKDNAKAFLITKSLAQLTSLIQAVGGNGTTAYELAGIGDLIVTGYGSESKNRTFGKQLATQKTDTVFDSSHYVCEGIGTSRTIFKIIQENKLELSIFTGIYKILYEKKSVQEIVNHWFLGN